MTNVCYFFCCYLFLKIFLHVSLASREESALAKYSEDVFEFVDVTMICSPIKVTFVDDMI